MRDFLYPLHWCPKAIILFLVNDLWVNIWRVLVRLYSTCTHPTYVTICILKHVLCRISWIQKHWGSHWLMLLFMVHWGLIGLFNWKTRIFTLQELLYWSVKHCRGIPMGLKTIELFGLMSSACCTATALVICCVFGKFALMKLVSRLHYIFRIYWSTFLAIFDPVTFLTLFV